MNTQTNCITPLAGMACCLHVSEYHPPCAPDGADPLSVGEILDNRFLITGIISRSGMAMIFKAQDLRDNNAAVALKVPHRQIGSDPDFLTRFQREEEIGLKLDHPYILRSLSITTPQSRPYIVTEYVRGCTLAHLLEAMSPLPEKDVLKIGSLMCKALQYLHEQGIVHGDLKPQNIMIGCDGTIRLLDFGLANSRDLRRGASASLTPGRGTPDYMAPEQARGKRGDARTDVYSLGAMLYEMLTGRAPFEGDNSLAVMNARVLSDPEPLRKLNPALSLELEEIVLHAMERSPAKRHHSAQALGAELENPSSVTVCGRCDRAEEVTQWKVGLRQYRGAILALIVSAVVPAAVALCVLLLHGTR
jgi:serine/threonine-protein kinase